MTSATPKSDLPSIILISGYWLGAWAWDHVTEHLTQAGFRTIAITLPGLDKHDPKRATRTLDDQVAAIESVIDAEGGNVILVAHSGANG
ncbi:alpha/beta fold hydrolase, partial [Corynebacterium casei]